MKILELKNIGKLIFGYEDIARALNISYASAMVTASRYVNAGFIIRLKRNLYILKDKWDRLERDQIFYIANLIQTPSYISLMTALSFYQVTTQMQRTFYESVAIKRTKTVQVEKSVFTYNKIKPKLYKGFHRKDNYFIAGPEKAYLDAVYLKSLGRYSFDLYSIDFNKLDKHIMNGFLDLYPIQVKKIVAEI